MTPFLNYILFTKVNCLEFICFSTNYHDDNYHHHHNYNNYNYNNNHHNNDNNNQYDVKHNHNTQYGGRCDIKR